MARGINFMLVRTVFGAVLGMFYFGFNTGVVNAPEAAIKSFSKESYFQHYDVQLSDSQLSTLFTIITNAFIVGGMVGAMIGGVVADKVGRRRGLLLSSVMGGLGGVIMAISESVVSWEVLVVGRLVVGLSAGLNTVLVPTYVSEIAPLQLRGGLGVFNQLAVTCGIFFGQILGLGEVLGNEDGWPWLLAITIIPCVLQILILFWSPMSPRYLGITLANTEEAREALMQLRNNDVSMVEEEMEEIREELEKVKEPEMSVMELLVSRKLRVSLIICIVMHLSQQLCGISAIFYYSVQFFKSAGIDDDQARYSTLGIGAIMVSMTFITIPLMDRLGRRVLQLTSLLGTLVMAVLIVIAHNLEISGFLIATTLLFVVFFALGNGSIPWLITGEMFTQGSRSAASAIVVFINWSANLTVGLIFPLVLIPLLDSFTFLPFAILLAFFTLFVYLFLPETKGVTVNETSQLLQDKGWKNRRYS